ncbi:D-beta-hydroxybutyrate dehydrogenase [Vanrija pseudolonga]|uniref:3-oxoacyl-[acyl-carrier-protein] reductase n=1 Tax=Vanrija pseudolonga TaxID=143232 RepID=A0AAF0Y5B9_9TREE|nr:D-beta-hydroxybutyrate dehydrogenase [Vanrija pseudolonga]
MAAAVARKHALVTGSTSGIGRGIATALAAARYDITLNGFGNPDDIAALHKELETFYGVKVRYSNADMSKPAEIKTMIEQAIADGGLDVLVNNAGVQHVSRVEDFADDAWDRVISINLSSAFHTSKHALPHFQAKGWGRIVNIASVHGHIGSTNKAAYVAAKHGIVGLTKVLALENANQGITANAICPGWVLTPLVKEQIEARAAKNGTTVEHETNALLGEKQPMLKFTTPEKIGATVVFLCSDAADTITGSSLTVDGGWTAQ